VSHFLAETSPGLAAIRTARGVPEGINSSVGESPTRATGNKRPLALVIHQTEIVEELCPR
jgi:hypothetical protein